MNTSASKSQSHPPPAYDLTDEQWRRIVPLLPEMKEHGPRRGRPCIDIRWVVNSVMWVLHARAPWSAMPKCYAPYQTAHRYYLRWKKSGVLANIVLALFETDTLLERPVTRRGGVRAA
jgi:transposase